MLMAKYNEYNGIIKHARTPIKNVTWSAFVKGLLYGACRVSGFGGGMMASRAVDEVVDSGSDASGQSAGISYSATALSTAPIIVVS